MAMHFAGQYECYTSFSSFFSTDSCGRYPFSCAAMHKFSAAHPKLMYNSGSSGQQSAVTDRNRAISQSRWVVFLNNQGCVLWPEGFYRIRNQFFEDRVLCLGVGRNRNYCCHTHCY